jgi:hypothetical protein
MALETKGWIFRNTKRNHGNEICFVTYYIHLMRSTLYTHILLDECFLTVQCIKPGTLNFGHTQSWFYVIILLSIHMLIYKECLKLICHSIHYKEQSTEHNFSLMLATCTKYVILLDFITLIMFGEQQMLWTFSLCNCLHPPFTSPLLSLKVLLHPKQTAEFMNPMYSWDLRFSWQWLLRALSSGVWRYTECFKKSFTTLKEYTNLCSCKALFETPYIIWQKFPTFLTIVLPQYSEICFLLASC